MTPKGGTPSMGAAHTSTPEYIEHDGKFFRRHRGTWQFSTKRDGGVWHYSVESDIEAWLNKVEFLAAGRDAAESLVSAQHDALVAMKNERDWWEHRAEVAERQNGEALAMLAFTGEPSSLWQAAAAARVKMHALTAHMNQVHETLGGSDTVLTLEAAQCVVAKLAEAERERDDAKINETLSNEQRAVLFCENAKLLAELDAAEKLTYWFLKKYPATWARAKRTLFADTARTAATACERSSPIASGDTQGE
jgi:hypothetical protein